MKNLYSYTRGALTHAPYWQDLTRARLTLDVSAPVKDLVLEGHVDYDHELRAGSFFNTVEYRTLGLLEPPAYLDLDDTLGSGNSYLYRHRLYRGWAGGRMGDATLRFGRQRVAWGTGKMWNPTDVLNPYQPTSLESEERRGVDALYFRKGIGELGQGEGVYALGDRWASTSLLARLKGHRGDGDFSLMGGKIAGSTNSWMMGGDFASNLYGGDLHGELAYSDPRIRTPYWKAMLGYEYSFSSGSVWSWLRDLKALAEYFHNGAGELDVRRYQFASLLSGREIALGRDYAGVGLQKDLHPLVAADVHQILNLHDHSHFLSASLNWNALANLYLLAGWQRFGGTPLSEFGRAANIAFLQGQYFF